MKMWSFAQKARTFKEDLHEAKIVSEMAPWSATLSATLARKFEISDV